jgi:hypothetical protein
MAPYTIATTDRKMSAGIQNWVPYGKSGRPKRMKP